MLNLSVGNIKDYTTRLTRRKLTVVTKYFRMQFDCRVRSRTASRGQQVEGSSTTRTCREHRRQPYNLRSKSVTRKSGFSSPEERQFVIDKWDQTPSLNLEESLVMDPKKENKCSVGRLQMEESKPESHAVWFFSIISSDILPGHFCGTSSPDEYIFSHTKVYHQDGCIFPIVKNELLFKPFSKSYETFVVNNYLLYW
ncbi:hypothetical protein TNCV_3359211 [Trichonephila clavipes]|nr:hypothetical protein TNCV_3359211 [Trichonephila clavipes]